jgi:hypothetical protein
MKIIPHDGGEVWPHDYAEYMNEMRSEEWPDDNKELEKIARDEAEDRKREQKLKEQRTKDVEVKNDKK